MAAAFKEKYGPWALVAGGAEGIGLAYATHIAAQGVDLLIVDRDREKLHSACRALGSEFGVTCVPVDADLADRAILETVTEVVAEREVGLLVYNAALADVGPFFKTETGLDHELDKAQVNMLSPLSLIYHFAQPMLARKCGGVVLMSSGAGLQGSPYYSHYAATKAYSIILAESLWYEFKPYHVDVLACIAGMTLSPGVAAAVERGEGQRSTYQSPDEVVQEAMAALGVAPSHICGLHNRDNQALLHSLPRDQAVSAIAGHALDNFLDGKPPEQALTAAET
ncbi:MAG: short-subunit dehydrogenase [Bermanella sp.]|jgi:short-subunit dehydrogenase